MSATCPDTGSAIGWFAPADTTEPSDDEETLTSSYNAFSATM